MNRDEIKLKVLQCIDEVDNINTRNYGLEYPIDAMLDESARYILSVAPLKCIDNRTDFSDATITPNDDGSGEIPLPENFIRLITFKMKGWEREVTLATDISDKRYDMQFNKYTRAKEARPMVFIDGGYLKYFSVTKGAHTIEKAQAITEVEAGEMFPKRLIDCLCWLTASKILQVMNEDGSATKASEQFVTLLTAL